jgi:hypothetical protein
MPPNPWLSKHTAPNIHHCATVEEAAAVVVQQERYISKCLDTRECCQEEAGRYVPLLS